jgi:ubiquinone/menaquinone biosynthesis C-methylase UbiE
MGFYENRILPHVIGLACSGKPIRRQRQKVVPLAEGDVLEIGFGTGLNLPYYDKKRVRKIWGLEPSQGMRDKARPSVAKSGLDVEFIDLPGEEIPLENQSIDTVLVTYSLCTIPDAVRALDGMRRVLKPGGRLVYCEHGKAPEPSVLRWQNRVDPAWSRFAGGCHINRDIPALLEAGGFQISDDQRMFIPGPRIVSYNYWGVAVTAG